MVIVVFDTNIWVSDLALTSNVGSALRFFLGKHKARVGLPEVVRLEAEIHLRNALLKHGEQADASTQMFGICCDAPERLGSNTKEDIADDFFILPG